ncbi:MAG: C39 family peptidase [bacterium]|nr:C39 family peptidase [bacterium]
MRAFPFFVFALTTIALIALFATLPPTAQSQEQAIIEFMRDSATLGFANIMLEKGLNPLSYDSFLEFKQALANTKSGVVKVTKLDVFGQTVGSTGNDPMAFYIDEQINENIIETVRTTAGESFPFNYPFAIPRGGGIGVPPGFGPIPPPQDGVLLQVPLSSQTDSRWATNTIDGCRDTLWGSGCGPTSLAMVLNYFGKGVTPLQIAQPLRNRVEYFCGTGSSLLGLANIARDQYGLRYTSISFSEIEAQLKEGHPVIGSFGCFQFSPGRCSGHITVIRGIGRCTIGGRTDTCLYFQDTFALNGEIAFFASTVINSFRTNVLYAFSQ